MKQPYQIYRQWGLQFYKEATTAEEAWEFIGELPFGEGYDVQDAEGNTRPEFVPF